MKGESEGVDEGESDHVKVTCTIDDVGVRVLTPPPPRLSPLTHSPSPSPSHPILILHPYPHPRPSPFTKVLPAGAAVRCPQHHARLFAVSRAEAVRHHQRERRPVRRCACPAILRTRPAIDKRRVVYSHHRAEEELATLVTAWWSVRWSAGPTPLAIAVGEVGDGGGREGLQGHLRRTAQRDTGGGTGYRAQGTGYGVQGAGPPVLRG